MTKTHTRQLSHHHARTMEPANVYGNPKIDEIMKPSSIESNSPECQNEVWVKKTGLTRNGWLILRNEPNTLFKGWSVGPQLSPSPCVRLQARNLLIYQFSRLPIVVAKSRISLAMSTATTHEKSYYPDPPFVAFVPTNMMSYPRI